MGCSTTESHAEVPFATEAAMVEQFLALVRDGVSPWGPLQTTTEWDYRTGITDVLARTSSGQLVAFEAKLADWRRASHQAYRNTTFAGRTYVLLPSATAKRVRANEQVFSRYCIGLCAVDADRIEILIEAPEAVPLLPWLHKRAQSYFDEDSREHVRAQPRRARCRALQGA